MNLAPIRPRHGSRGYGPKRMGLGDGRKPVQPSFACLDYSNAHVKAAVRSGLDVRLSGLVALGVRQPRDAFASQGAAMGAVSRNAGARMRKAGA